MKYLKIIIFLILLIITFSTKPEKVQAAKKFIPKQKSVVKVSSGRIPAIVRYRPDRLGILLSLSNFTGIESVSYSFTYNTNGIPQGVGGAITANNNPTQVRELLLGTCSTAVCTYHHNLTNAKLILRVKYTNGKTGGKIYRIKTYQ